MFSTIFLGLLTVLVTGSRPSFQYLNSRLQPVSSSPSVIVDSLEQPSYVVTRVDGTSTIWSYQNRTLLQTVPRSTGFADRDSAFSPDYRWLVTVQCVSPGSDCRLVIWRRDQDTFAQLSSHRVPESKSLRLFKEDDAYSVLLLCQTKILVYRMDTSDGSLELLQEHSGEADWVARLPNNHLLAWQHGELQTYRRASPADQYELLTGFAPQPAIDLPNFGSLNGPTLLEEKRFPPAFVEALRAAGHEVKEVGMTSGVQAIRKDHGSYDGGADPRREGRVMGE